MSVFMIASLVFVKRVANMRKLWIESVIGGALMIPVSAIVFYVLWLWRKHIIEGKLLHYIFASLLGLFI